MEQSFGKSEIKILPEEAHKTLVQFPNTYTAWTIVFVHHEISMY